MPFNSMIFLGKSQEMLEKYTESFNAYKRAATIDPENPTAYKGLLVLASNRKSFNDLLQAIAGLIRCCENEDNINKAVEYFETARKFCIKNPSDIHDVAFLKFQLPGSPIFQYMEGRLPHPSLTFAKLIKYSEKSKKDALAKLKRGNLSFGKTAADDSKVFEIYKSSKLPELYENLLNWSNDEEQRRLTENNLLEHVYQMLLVAPANIKPSLVQKVKDLASGSVLLKTPFPFAWEIEIEWSDVVDFKDYDYNLLRSYVDNFPDEPLAKTLTGFLESSISPFVVDKTSEKDKDPSVEKKEKEFSDGTPNEFKDSEEGNEQQQEEEEKEDSDALVNSEILDEEDSNIFSPALILEYLIDGYASKPDSILISRIIGAYYIKLREYETASDVSLKALKLVSEKTKRIGNIFQNSTNHICANLGTSYVFYQAPKNFSLAVKMFDTVLRSNPHYTAAKVGKGLVFREQGEYDQAEKYFKDALVESPNDNIVFFEYSWCQVLQKRYDEGRNGLHKALEGFKGIDLLSHDYRSQIWWRIGQSYWLQYDFTKDADQEKISTIFSAFMSALNENPNMAAAFTSLGKLYSMVLKDMVRATKCFYKAFELDGGEIEAAEYLATEYADSMQWDLVEIVAKRVVESENIRFSSEKEPSWPYRALGIACLNSHDYENAVKYFQNALRLLPDDSNLWVGLGEAYSSSGRYVAAIKTFTRAQDLDPSNWVATYHLGTVQKLTEDYQGAIKTFQQVLSLKPEERGVKFALIETILLAAKHELKKEVFGQAALLATACIKTISKALKSGLTLTQDLWNILSECCKIFLTVKSTIEKAPLDVLVDLAKEYTPSIPENSDMVSLTEIDSVTIAKLEDLLNQPNEEENERALNAQLTNQLYLLYILFSKISFGYARKDKTTRALAWYNLGLSELNVYLDQENKNSDILNASIDCFKRVIRLQNQDPDVWNAYGVACSFVNVKVAQHCFIRCLILDSKQSVAWNNLAILYIQKGDIQLSELAIGRSLIIDPDFVPAWIGQGIISHTVGNATGAQKSFEHSFKISNGMSKLSKLYYSLTVFEQLKNNPNKAKLSQKLENAVLSLQKYLRLSPKSPLALTLMGLILERNSEFDYAIEQTTKICNIYEQEYEVTEDQDTLLKFVKVKAQLARLLLSARRFEEAVEHAQFASDISEESAASGDELSEELKKSRLSAFLTTGLAYYFLKDYGNSIESFKHALIESEEDQDVIVLLAQVLWAQGGDDEKEVALEQLFGSIEKNGATCKLALTLGAIGIIYDDGLIEAAQDELNTFPETKLAVEDTENQVPRMLAAMNRSTGKDVKEPWYRAAFYKPWVFDVWKHLEPETALRLAQDGTMVSTTELSEAYTAVEGSGKEAARAVFYAPWSSNAWVSLAKTLS